jgi:hypothetical protein
MHETVQIFKDRGLPEIFSFFKRKIESKEDATTHNNQWHGKLSQKQLTLQHPQSSQV